MRIQRGLQAELTSNCDIRLTLKSLRLYAVQFWASALWSWDICLTTWTWATNLCIAVPNRAYPVSWPYLSLKCDTQQPPQPPSDALQGLEGRSREHIVSRSLEEDRKLCFIHYCLYVLETPRKLKSSQLGIEKYHLSNTENSEAMSCSFRELVSFLTLTR